MKKNTFRAFDDGQLALLKSLLPLDYKAPDRRPKIEDKRARAPKQHSPSVTAQRRGNTTLDPGDLNMIPDHAQRAARSDFSWLPSPYNPVIERALHHSKVKVRPRRDQLIVIGHIYFRKGADETTIGDSINLDGSVTRVDWTRIDPALEHALNFKRLSWVALVHNGRAVEWDPAYLELIDRFSLDGSRHLNISVLQGRNKAISKTLQSGMLCVALLADSLRVPKSATIEQEKRYQGTRKPKKDYVRANLPSGGISAAFSDGGSSLISGGGWARSSTDKQPKKRSQIGKNVPKPAIIKPPVIPAKTTKRGRYLGIDLCSRCNGGELPNCPVCDGRGFVDRYEGEPQSAIRLGRNTSLNGAMGAAANIGKSASVADHEAVGRADPQDANREASGIRDDSRFGSMPLYDNYDD